MPLVRSSKDLKHIQAIFEGRGYSKFRIITQAKYDQLTPQADVVYVILDDVWTTEDELTLAANVAQVAALTARYQTGETADRPETPTDGDLFFDTTLSKLLIYITDAWFSVDVSALA